MACSTLPLEIAENNLTHCYYFAVHCRKDGEIRVAAGEAPSDECCRCPPAAARRFWFDSRLREPDSGLKWLLV
jgi:hypothetical protein